MSIHDLPDDGQSEARSTGRAGHIGPIESVEDMGNVLLRNAGAVVLHLETDYSMSAWAGLSVFLIFF